MVRRTLTHAQQERQQTENRRKEDVRQDHIKRLHQEKLFEANMASEERVETKRYIRQIQKEEMERQMLDNTTRVSRPHGRLFSPPSYLFLFLLP